MGGAASAAAAAVAAAAGAVGPAAAALAGGLSWGAAAALGSPRFARAHALALAALVAMGPLLRAHADPHSLLARPHNLLEARLVSSAGGWTALLAGGLLVAAWPLARPGGGRRGALLRAGGRLAAGAGLARAAPGLFAALEAAGGRCLGRGAFAVSPQAFALTHCGLGLAEELGALGRLLHPPPGPRRPGAAGPPPGARRGPRRPGVLLLLPPPPPLSAASPPRAPGRAAAGPGVRALSPVWLGAYDDAQGPRRPGARGAGAEGWREDEGPRRPGTALCLLFLLNVGLLLLWHGLLAATLAYRHDWAGNAAGAALGWAAWALTYRLWYRCPCSPGRPGLGLQPR